MFKISACTVPDIAYNFPHPAHRARPYEDKRRAFPYTSLVGYVPLQDNLLPDLDEVDRDGELE